MIFFFFIVLILPAPVRLTVVISGSSRGKRKTGGNCENNGCDIRCFLDYISSCNELFRHHDSPFLIDLSHQQVQRLQF